MECGIVDALEAMDDVRVCVCMGGCCTLHSFFFRIKIPACAQPYNPGPSLERQEGGAPVHTDFAFSGGQQNKTKIHATASTRLDRMIQSQNERHF